MTSIEYWVICEGMKAIVLRIHFRIRRKHNVRRLLRSELLDYWCCVKEKSSALTVCLHLITGWERVNGWSAVHRRRGRTVGRGAVFIWSSPTTCSPGKSTHKKLVARVHLFLVSSLVRFHLLQGIFVCYGQEMENSLSIKYNLECRNENFAERR